MDLDNEELRVTRNREKSVDEMFAELGYIKKVKYSNEIDYFDELYVERIGFLTNPIKGVDKAINKKCQELWLAR